MKIKVKSVCYGFGSILLVMTGCGQSIPEFDSQSAWKYLTAQCSFGPRNPGSEGYAFCREYLTSQLQTTADTVFHQPFQLANPLDGNQYQLANIIGRFAPEHTTRLLLGAHWDTRPWADRDPDPQRRSEPILGANDGASGVAVLLEIARILKENPPPIGIDIVFFDGEDMGLEGQPRTYAKGSQYFATHLPLPEPQAAIVVDMIGDRDLSIPVERNSMNQNPVLVRRLWDLAGDLNLPAFENRILPNVYDDHIPLYEIAGIKAIDIIDFEYPNRHANFWHTHQDIPANCSPASLNQVGTLLVHYIYGQYQ